MFVNIRQIDWVGVAREAFVSSLFFLPAKTNIAIERWLRGLSEFKRLQRADCVVVSYPNSGRTWLRVLLTRYYQNRVDMGGDGLTSLESLARKHAAVPRFYFTHDNYLRDYTGHASLKSAYASKRVILLVRDPADVTVSQYYQWKHRMRRRKMVINGYPLTDGISLFAFSMTPGGVLARIIKFMNEWAGEVTRLENILVIRYEDLHADTEGTLRKILDFVGTPGDPEQIRNSIGFASIANMRKLEQSGNPLLVSGRLFSNRAEGVNRLKARRAKLGGYREDFSEIEAFRIDKMINTELSSFFRYHRKLPDHFSADSKSA